MEKLIGRNMVVSFKRLSLPLNYSCVAYFTAPLRVCRMINLRGLQEKSTLGVEYMQSGYLPVFARIERRPVKVRTA
ncbi:MAG: hypothetical protein ACTTIT_07895 [Treponema sp.]